MAEGHGAGGAARCDCTQSCHITEHLSQRSLSLDDAGTAAACLHTLYLTATLVEVADHVTHALLGSNNLDLHDGLHQDGVGLL